MSFSKEMRWAIIGEVQALLSGGMVVRQVAETLMRPGKILMGGGQVQRPALGKTAAYRYVSRAFKEWKKNRQRFNREGYLSVQLDARQRAMRMALTAKKTVIVDGVEHKIDESDIDKVKAYLAANESLCKLLGLDEPDRLVVENFGGQFRELLTILAEEITDRALLERIITRFRSWTSGQAAAKTPGTVVVEAPKALPHEPSSNGSSG